MNANYVAKKVRAMGFDVLKVTEGDEARDGAVKLSKAVHIQVPIYGTEVGIVREGNDGLHFYMATADLKLLEEDLVDALSR